MTNATALAGVAALVVVGLLGKAWGEAQARGELQPLISERERRIAELEKQRDEAVYEIGEERSRTGKQQQQYCKEEKEMMLDAICKGHWRPDCTKR
jgi:hypothetical protein